MIDIALYVLALSFAVVSHGTALALGLSILHEFHHEFTARPCILQNGIDEVEVSYMAIVLSTLIAPVTVYHLAVDVVNFSEFSGTNKWDAAYWLALGLLLSLFHIITKKHMEKVRKYGIHSSFV